VVHRPLRFHCCDDAASAAGGARARPRRGLAKGRFTFRPEQTPSMRAFVGSAALAAMWLVLHSAKTWRARRARTPRRRRRARSG
jgi:hypothetical protein